MDKKTRKKRNTQRKINYTYKMLSKSLPWVSEFQGGHVEVNANEVI